MKLLFAANRFPYPPFRGDKLKIYNLAKRLSKYHELHLITFLEDNEDQKYLPELQKIFKKITLIPLPKYQSYFNVLKAGLTKTPFQVAYFTSNKMKRLIGKHLQEEKYDAIHVQHLRMAQYFSKYKKIPRILDLPDAYSLYWKRRVETTTGTKQKFNKMEFERVSKYEPILNQFDMTLACSREDANWLKTQQSIQRVNILPNGVDTTTFNSKAHDYSHNQTILFTGNMDYAPNVDAVCYFESEIFPKLKESFPNIKFIIAGQRPVKRVLDLQSEDVEVTGFVPNLADMYRKASLVVAPLRFGAGTQNKVLEAMSMAIPVVSMNVGFAGLNIESGEGVVLAPTTQEFIDACKSLLSDAAYREKVGKLGKETIMTKFDWDVVAHQLEEYFYSIVFKSK